MELAVKAVQINPVHHTAPRCADFQDELAVRQYERAVRVHRAYTETWLVSRLDGRIDGSYRVSGEKRTAYYVDIVDGSGAHDTCTCPDFLTNRIGTCKHLEAVRRSIDRVKADAAGYRALPAMPLSPVITVQTNPSLSLRLLGKWTARQLASHGLRPGDRELRPESGGSLHAGWNDSGVRVVHAAIPAAERLRSADALARRRHEMQHAFASSALGTDVLSQPLFPYQELGVQHLCVAGRALLADDMGLGKTVQAIAACEILRRRGEASRVLVVTPASLKDQWAREVRKYTGQTAVVVGGNPAARREAFRSDAPYKILNYELTWRELRQLQALEADILVLDEAQRAKNFRTKTANTLREIPSKFLFVLTGTPVENRLDDLYSLLQLVDPELLGPLWKFNLEFHKQDGKGKIVGYKQLSLLRERIAPVVMRRRKDEVLLQLPPITEQTRYTPLTREQRDLDEEYRHKAARIAQLAERRPLTKEEQEILASLLLKARQACNALELCAPDAKKKASPKLDEFEALVGEIVSQGTSKILVFSEWVEMLHLAAERLDALQIPYAMLHGGIPTARRPALLERFREDSSLRVLLSSDAGGVGLNLQVASYVIHLDLPWNPGKLDQRTARAHRLGQTRGVSVTYLVSEVGTERGIEGTLAGKRAVREAALDAASRVDDLEAPSFAVFLRQLREVLENAAAPGHDVEVVDLPEEPVAVEAAEPTLAAAPPPELTLSPALAAAEPSTPSTRPQARAKNRLRLAEVVLREGFHADAVRAAYDALSSTIRALAEGEVGPSHDALVAVVYRELLPSGKLPVAAHAALAQLRDLTLLEGQGVEVGQSVAEAAVAEARRWVDRLGPGSQETVDKAEGTG